VLEPIEGLNPSFVYVKIFPWHGICCNFNETCFSQSGKAARSGRPTRDREPAFPSTLFIKLIRSVPVEATARSPHRSTSRPRSRPCGHARHRDESLSGVLSPGADFRHRQIPTAFRIPGGQCFQVNGPIEGARFQDASVTARDIKASGFGSNKGQLFLTRAASSAGATGKAPTPRLPANPRNAVEWTLPHPLSSTLLGGEGGQLYVCFPITNDNRLNTNPPDRHRATSADFFLF
jgi:hypothetical protein